jgi:hypothetical protein
MMTTIEAAQSENVVVFTIRYTQKEHGQLTARNKYGIRVMDRIAKETGGAHIDAETTDPHTYFRQIAEELRTSYELAYYPSDPVRDSAQAGRRIRPSQNRLLCADFPLSPVRYSNFSSRRKRARKGNQLHMRLCRDQCCRCFWVHAAEAWRVCSVPAKLASLCSFETFPLCSGFTR